MAPQRCHLFYALKYTQKCIKTNLYFCALFHLENIPIWVYNTYIKQRQTKPNKPTNGGTQNVCKRKRKIHDKGAVFYNVYIDLYCVIGTTLSFECLSDMEEMFEPADLLEEVAMPDYITKDYEGTEW